eukprot:ANDGO_00365.mRNA.1 Putative 3
MSKSLCNDVQSVVTDSIDGYLLSRPDLVRLDGYPGTKVVARRVIPADEVAIISGGGAGHEPSHVGLVADGLLTAAVSGDVFASPHVHAILAAIRYVCQFTKCGVLLIVKNYTGDRLAFGLASQFATSELGIEISVVFVADDIALTESKIGNRGIAGTVLVHKCAAAVAASKASLETVTLAAQSASSHVLSIGASLSVCTVPGVPRSTRLDQPETSVEVGLGIHGEPGALVLNFLPTADALAASLVAKLAEKAAPSATRNLAVFVNNLGGLSNLEMGVACKSTFHALQSAGFAVLRFISGAIMTSLDMRGFSISVLPADLEIAGEMNVAQCLDAPTMAPSWPSTFGGKGSTSSLNSLSIVAPLAATQRPEHNISGVNSGPPAVITGGESSKLERRRQRIRNAAFSACNALLSTTAELTRLDTIAGDGDAGLSFSAISQAALTVVASTDLFSCSNGSLSSDVSVLCLRVAHEIGALVGGTSGVLYALMFAAAGTAVLTIDAEHLNDPVVVMHTALSSALQAVQKFGKAKAGDRTMLDSLLPVLSVLSTHAAVSAAPPAASGSPMGCDSVAMSSLMQRVKQAAQNGAEQTRGMAPSAGRAAYVNPELARGEMDAGAAAAATWITALCDFFSP